MPNRLGIFYALRLVNCGPPHMAQQKQDDQQLCEDTGCNPEDQPKAMNDWEKWRERVRDIRASGVT